MVGIVSVVRNHTFGEVESFLKLLLASTQTVEDKVLVDDGSVFNRETKALAQQYGWKYHEHDSPQGDGISLNEAMDWIKSEHIIIAGPDNYFAPGTIEQFDTLLGKTDVIGPQLNERFTFTKQYNAKAPKLNKGLDMIDAYAKHMQSQFQDKLIDTAITGAVFGINKSVFQDVGGYDESFATGVYDDTEFLERVRQADYELRFAPGIFVHHGGFTGRSRTIFQEGNKPVETAGNSNFVKYAHTLGKRHLSENSFPEWLITTVGFVGAGLYSARGLMYSTGVGTISGKTKKSDLKLHSFISI